MENPAMTLGELMEIVPGPDFPTGAMSLAQLRKLDEDGVRFQSHIDGQKYHLTPERSVEIQGLLGSDIQMQLDECIKLPNPRDEVQRAMELSLRWAERSRNQFEAMGGPAKGQGLYGIVQGGDQPDLRIRSAEELSKMPFEGYSVGGLAVGEPQEVMDLPNSWLLCRNPSDFRAFSNPKTMHIPGLRSLLKNTKACEGGRFSSVTSNET